MDVRKHNRAAWDSLVDQGIRWSIPADEAEVAAARLGKLQLYLTPSKFVPMAWYPQLAGLPTLCLATGGGQQAPLLAAAGADVTTLDNSEKQLGQDRLVAQREGLDVKTVQGDMADLSMFADGQFGLIFHACSNCFSETVLPVWKEAFRVLRPGGVLLAGFWDPVWFAISEVDHDRNHLQITQKLPWSDLEGLSEDELKKTRYDVNEPLQFSHTLEEQIGGQMAAGFHMTGMFGDRWTNTDKDEDPLSNYMDTFIATRSIRPA